MRLFEIIQHDPSAIHDREKKKRSLLEGQNRRHFSEEKRTTMSTPVKYNHESAVVAHYVAQSVKLILIIQIVYYMILDSQMQ